MAAQSRPSGSTVTSMYRTATGGRCRKFKQSPSTEVTNIIFSQALTLGNSGLLPMRSRPISELTGFCPSTAKTVVFWYIVCRLVLRAYRHLRIYGLTTTLYQGYLELSRRVVTLLLQLPAAKRRVAKELDAATNDIEAKLIPRPRNLQVNDRLPAYGKDRDWIREELAKLQRLSPPHASDRPSKEGLVNAVRHDDDGEDSVDAELAWRSGKVSGAVYHGGQELSDLIAHGIKMFLISNPVSAANVDVDIGPALNIGPSFDPHSYTPTSSLACDVWRPRSSPCASVCITLPLQHAGPPLRAGQSPS